jgi:predicted dehydrogenase
MAVFGSGHGFSTIIPAALSTNLFDIYAARSRYQKQIIIPSEKHSVREESRENLFQNFEFDLAVVAVPPCEQLELVRNLISKSKNIYLEKPAGLNSFEAVQIETLARDFSRDIFVGYQFRFDPAIQFCKKLMVNSNSFSKVSINWHTVGDGGKNDPFNWRNNPAKGGGVHTNFLVHVIDYLFFIIGQDKLNNKCQWTVLENNLNCISLFCVGSIEIEIKISRGKVKKSYWEIILINSGGEIFIKHSSPFNKWSYKSNNQIFLKTLESSNFSTDIRMQSTAQLLVAIGSKIEQAENFSLDLPTIHDGILVHKLIENIFNSYA